MIMEKKDGFHIQTRTEDRLDTAHNRAYYSALYTK